MARGHPEGSRKIDTVESFAAGLDALRRTSGKSYRRLADECGLGFNTVAGYCSGRHLPQLSVRAQFSRLLAAMGVSVGDDQDEWFRALAALRARNGRSANGTGNPYRGLLPFRPEDTAMFYGRSDLTDRLLNRLAECRVTGGPLVVVGPSGSGKSSLLRAGLLPRLSSAVVVTPGAKPMVAWGEATIAAEGCTVVIVDQFEELFTICPSEAVREEFLTAVLEWPGPVVIGLRADFYDRAARLPRLASVLQRAQVLVEPMTTMQITEVIVEPARIAGLDLEPGLVELLLRDASHEPAVLPLLSHTMHTIVELATHVSARASSIGIEHYKTAGGLHGAVARTADVAYATLTAVQRDVARRLFLRLVRTADGMADTRRRVAFDELFDGRALGQADDLTDVLETFVSHRLLVVAAETVEIAHEALLTAWPRLQAWLADDRVGHLVRSRLTTAARTWLDDGKSSDLLYRGMALATALDWARDPEWRTALNTLEQEFLDASAEARDAAVRAERRRIRRGYQMIAALIVLVLIAAGIGLYARQTRIRADEEARLALSRRIAAVAVRLRDHDPALAAQFSLAAYTTAATTEARSALLDTSARLLPRRLRPADGPAVALTAGHDVLAAGTANGQVELWPAAADSPPIDTSTRLRAGKTVSAVALSPDGAMLAASDAKGQLSVWRVADTSHPVSVELANTTVVDLRTLVFSGNGRFLAGGSANGTVSLWGVQSGATPTVLDAGHDLRSVAFSPAADLLAAAGDDGQVRLWRLSEPGQPRPLPPLTGPASKIFDIAFAPDGRTVAAATAGEHSIYLWDIGDLDKPALIGSPLTGPASWVNTVAFSPDGATLAAGSGDNFVWEWEWSSRQLVRKLPHTKPVIDLTFRGNAVLDSLAEDGIIRTWTLPGPELVGSTNSVFSVSFNAAGDRLLVGSGDGTLRLWDMHNRERPAFLGSPGGTPGLALSGGSAISPDGSTAIAGTKDGNLAVWRVRPDGAFSDTPLPLPLGRELVQAMVFSPDGRSAAITSDDGATYLIDVTDADHARVLSRLAGPDGVTFGVRFSPDGRTLAVTSDERGGAGLGYIWDVTDHTHPRLLTRIEGFTDAVYAAAFSSDRSLLALGSSDYTVHLVDATNPANPIPLGTLIGPVGEVYEVAFHPTQPLLAVSSMDGTIWLWDLHHPHTPQLIATLSAAEGGHYTVAFSPDGTTLAAGGLDQAVRLWNLDPDQGADHICHIVGDRITPSEWAQFVSDQPYTPPCSNR